MSADSDLLMVHADELSPVLEHALRSSSAAGEVVSGGYGDPEHLWDESREANELPAQRWGVIAPEGPEGDVVLPVAWPAERHCVSPRLILAGPAHGADAGDKIS